MADTHRNDFQEGMRIMKKQIALALTAAMTVGMLAGCSGKTPTAAGGSTVTSTGSETGSGR